MTGSDEQRSIHGLEYASTLSTYGLGTRLVSLLVRVGTVGPGRDGFAFSAADRLEASRSLR